MQPADDQPLRPLLNEQATSEESTRQAQGSKITQDFQNAQPADKLVPEQDMLVPDALEQETLPSVSEQQTLSSGASEQTLFPSVPYQPLSAAPGQAGAVPYQFNQPGQPGVTQGPGWSYPPPPEQYQAAAGQPGGSPTRPLAAAVPGQFNQAGNTFPQPFYSSTTMPAGQSAAGSSGAPVPAPRRSALRTGTLIALAALVALVFGTGLLAGWQFGHKGTTASSISNSAFQQGINPTVIVPRQTDGNADAVREAVVGKVQPGIVQINVTSNGQQALGSGVIVDRRGYIVTNNHVVTGATSIQVTLANNRTLPAQVTGIDPVDDIAVIKITPPSGGLVTVAMGDSVQLHPGQEVLAIGSPLGNAETVTRGIISALNRNISEGQNGPTLPDAIQTDASINPGNSGGALVDLAGNLIGMPTLNAVDTEFNTPANGLGFAIPVNRIRFIAQQIIANGHVSHTGRAILGVTVTSVTQSLATRDHLSVNSGVFIVNVSAGGPAASAGVKAGDVLVQMGNQTINGTNDLSTALVQTRPGDSVALKMNRGGQQVNLNVTLGELAVG
ncbi:MAG TPA: trypsin-like peptidase domain-containing protein [Ktedonobacteraceae bacterium]